MCVFWNLAFCVTNLITNRSSSKCSLQEKWHVSNFIYHHNFVFQMSKIIFEASGQILSLWKPPEPIYFRVFNNPYYSLGFSQKKKLKGLFIITPFFLPYCHGLERYSWIRYITNSEWTKHSNTATENLFWRQVYFYQLKRPHLEESLGCFFLLINLSIHLIRGKY